MHEYEIVQYRRGLELQPFGYGTSKPPGCSTPRRLEGHSLHRALRLRGDAYGSVWCAEEVIAGANRYRRSPCANAYVAYAAPSDNCFRAFVLRLPASSQASW
jgi:hypothetical protein